MKQITYIVVLLTALTMRTQAEVVVPTTQNSITTTVPLAKMTDPSSLNKSNSLIQIQYFDGLGRPSIKVDKGLSPSAGKDIVSMIAYGDDNLSEEWLPVPVPNLTTVPDPAALQQATKTFYGDEKPYTIRKKLYGPALEFESVVPPGKDWHDNNKTKQFTKTINHWNCKISMFVVEGEGVMKKDPHPLCSVDVHLSTDEDGKSTETYYDSNGRRIMFRKLLGEDTYADTYFVYDDIGNLRFVLPPKATWYLNRYTLYTSEGINTENNPLDQFAYIYRYDGLGRCIAQKNPGTDWVWQVYDLAGRPVLTQDGNQRETNAWSFRKYDGYGRIIQSGTVVLTESLDSIRNYYGSVTVKESWTNSGYSDVFNKGTDRKILKSYYYDDYRFLDLPVYSSIRSILSYTEASGFSKRCSRLVGGIDIATRGMLTGTVVALLNEPGEAVSALYYDNKGRVIQNLKTNLLNGYDNYYYSYSYQGNVTRQQHKHKAFSNAEIIEENSFSHDSKGRQTFANHSIKFDNGGEHTEITSTHMYDELGRVNKKYLHRSNYIINYAYNIHGQLKSITSPNFTQTLRYQDGWRVKNYNGNVSEIKESFWSDYKPNTETELFFYYDNLNRLTKFEEGFESQYLSSYYSYDTNGNIERITRAGIYPLPLTSRNGKIDDLEAKYSGNQLIKVNEIMLGTEEYYPTASDVDFKDSVREPIEYLYDANGNQTADANKHISWTKYNCLNLPHKLQMRNGDKIAYQYNASRMKKKATYSVALNTMHIPMGETGMENTTNIQTEFTRDYCDNFVYENGSLSRIYTPTGYLAANNSQMIPWKRVYNVTDYLGNVRLELEFPLFSGPTLPRMQRAYALYYPFGMEKTLSTRYNGSTVPSPKHQFGGNEFEPINTLYHDFRFRWYDQQLGRFLSQDPLVALDYSVSPYAYCDNNPINFIDPWGLTVKQTGSGKGYLTGEVSEVTITPSSNSYIGGGSPDFYFNNTTNSEGEDITRAEREALERTLREQGIEVAKKYSVGILEKTNNVFSYSLDGTDAVLDKSKLLFKGMQAESDALGLGLDYGKEMAKLSKWGRYVKVAGAASFAFSWSITEYQYSLGEISGIERIGDQVTNVISLIPLYGTAWSVGYELGKDYGPSTW